LTPPWFWRDLPIMQWTDEAVVLGTRRYGENASLLELMTRRHGRHLGLVRGGRSKRLVAVLQAGNLVEATWYARLDEHLGTYTVEGTDLRAARLIASAAALYGINWAAGLLRLLPERDPHEALFETMIVLLDHLEMPALLGALMARVELALLGELGFGLDLTRCAATGSTEDLIYVSPKSGRAVSRSAGEPYKERMLALPAFLGGRQPEGRKASDIEVAAGLELTGFFLKRDLYGPRGLAMPEARAAFLRLTFASSE
jgi:DNA repair protein RecO (recombination protein O)